MIDYQNLADRFARDANGVGGDSNSSGQGPAESESQKPQQWDGYNPLPLTSAEFAATDYRPTWLVRRILVNDQPAVFGGPKKTLKTSLAVALSLALGTGTPFLGEFAVPEIVRTLILSGESGPFTLQETARRQSEAMGITLADADVLWAFNLPQLANIHHLNDLANLLAEHQVKVLIIDPIYLCLLSGAKGIEASNVFSMGPLYLAVGRRVWPSVALRS